MTPGHGTTGAPHPGTCGPDEVAEHVCGRVTVEHDTPKAGAPPPHDKCPVHVADLDDLEDNGVIDGWRLDGKDKAYQGLAYAQARSAAYEVNNGVFPDEPRCCYEGCQALAVVAKARAAVPAGMHVYEECLPKPASASHPAAGAPGCPVAMHMRVWYPEGDVDPLDDAPFAREIEGSCCYAIASAHRCPPNTFETKDGCEEPNPGGRPLREAGVAVVAPTRARDGWLIETSIAGLSPAARAFAATSWAREAAFEHASVAAFARLSLDLMAHGAPAELVDAAHVAARDEIRHAQVCYGIAAAFGGAAVGPGPLAVGARTVTLEALAIECFRDGCVNETVAALCVAEAARRAEPESLRDALASIADDEARHAELSYRILAWALAQGGAPLRARIADELAALADPDAADPHPHHDERAGVLHATTAAAVRRRVLAEVVRPCTEALLAAAHSGSACSAPSAVVGSGSTKRRMT